LKREGGFVWSKKRRETRCSMRLRGGGKAFLSFGSDAPGSVHRGAKGRGVKRVGSRYWENRKEFIAWERGSLNGPKGEKEDSALL